MFDPVYLVTIFSPFVLFYLYLRWTYKGPPHMTGLPVVGYMPFLGKEPHLKFHELASKHGPIFSLYMGSIYTVVLCSYDVMQEAFIQKGTVFNGRPSYLVFKVYDHETAFVHSDGEEWKVARNFSMNTLKELGFGKNFTKTFVQTEIQDLIDEFKRLKGKPVDVEKPLYKSLSLLIMGLFTGKKYDRNERTGWMADVAETASTLMKSYSYDVAGMFPWLRKLSFLNAITVRKTIRTLKNKLWGLLEQEMSALRSTFSSSSEQENFIHSWYLEQEKRNKIDDPQKELFSDFNLKNNLDIFIQASIDTTPTSLQWALLHAMVYQDAQRKIHQEIDEYIGQNREPTLEDIKNMDYTKAFLSEVHRVTTIGPLGVFHSNKVEGSIRGFHIPKDTMIISNLWSVHHDPKVFPEPDKFDPGRFLDEQGKFKPSDALCSFSIGRRICPGKQVAEMQIFLYLVSLLQVFHLRSPPGSSPSDKDYIYDKNLVRRPAPFEIVFEERN